MHKTAKHVSFLNHRGFAPKKVFKTLCSKENKKKIFEAERTFENSILFFSVSRILILAKDKEGEKECCI